METDKVRILDNHFGRARLSIASTIMKITLPSIVCTQHRMHSAQDAVQQTSLLAVDIMPSQNERGVHRQDVQLVVPMGSHDYSNSKQYHPSFWCITVFPQKH